MIRAKIFSAERSSAQAQRLSASGAPAQDHFVLRTIPFFSSNAREN
jgi:hypothetical protein